MKVVFASEVRDEVEQARNYYETEVDGLGKAFLSTIKSSIDEIKAYPESSRMIRSPFRRFLTPRFPFGIIYRVEKDTIYIVAVAHLRRKPFYWQHRSA
jgi:plasmid stabilization system protein ParE